MEHPQQSTGCYIQAYAYRDSRGQTVPAAEVEAHGEGKNTT